MGLEINGEVVELVLDSYHEPCYELVQCQAGPLVEGTKVCVLGEKDLDSLKKRIEDYKREIEEWKDKYTIKCGRIERLEQSIVTREQEFIRLQDDFDILHGETLNSRKELGS